MQKETSKTAIHRINKKGMEEKDVSMQKKINSINQQATTSRGKN